MAAAYAFLANRVLVACSYAYPKPIKSKSEKAVPKNAKPKGTPGAGYTVSGPAGRIVTFSGKNPSGTEAYQSRQVKIEIRVRRTSDDGVSNDR